MKKDGTKLEILPALIAGEQQGVFKRPAIHPYYLKKAAWNSDRPSENAEWGAPPRVKRPDNAGDYRTMQKRAKQLGLGRTCIGLKGPELAEAIRKAEYEQSQSDPSGVSGHEGFSGQDGSVGEPSPRSAVEQDSTLVASPNRE